MELQVRLRHLAPEKRGGGASRYTHENIMSDIF